MKILIQKITRNNFIKVSSYVSISVFVRMLTNLVSIKVFAIMLGPAGLALIGQLNNFISILSTFATGGLTDGVVKYTAEFRKNNTKKELYIRSALWLTVFFSMTMGFVIVLFSCFFSEKILHTEKYNSIFLIFGLTIILYALNSILIAIINGHKEFKKFVFINIISSLIGLIFSLSLIFIFGLYGALLSAVTYQSFIILITLFIIYQSPWFHYSLILGKISKKAILNLVKYSLMAMVSAFSIPIIQIFLRDHIITTLSQVDAGIWEGMNRISRMYLIVITTTIGIYYLPRLSELKDKNKLKNEIINTYKVIIPFLVFTTVILYVSRHLIIKLLFSKEFYQMEKLFLFQFIGDFFKIASKLLLLLILAKTMTTTYIITEVAFSVILILGGIFFINHYNLVGVTYAYALNYFLYFLTMVIVCRKILY